MVYHILRDGRQVTDISGHIVRVDDAPEVYNVLDRIVRRLNNEKKEVQKKTVS